MCAYLSAGSPDYSMAFDRASITKEEAPTSPIVIPKVLLRNLNTQIKSRNMFLSSHLFIFSISHVCFCLLSRPCGRSQ